MKLGDDRIRHLSHLIVDRLYNDDLVDFPHDDHEPALRAIKRILRTYCEIDERAQDAARRKITSQSKMVVQGSREWDILYDKYLEEELNRHLPK